MEFAGELRSVKPCFVRNLWLRPTFHMEAPTCPPWCYRHGAVFIFSVLALPIASRCRLSPRKRVDPKKQTFLASPTNSGGFCGRLPPAAAVKKDVAVETRIAPRPPRRSRRALLTHRAPPLGSGVKAVQRLRMQDLDWRKEAAGKFDEFLPAEKRLLTAPPKRA